METEQLLAALLRGESGAIEQLAQATPEISNRVAKSLGRELTGDNATRVCELIPRLDGVLFQDGRRQLFAALTKACERDGNFGSSKVAMVKQRARAEDPQEGPGPATYVAQPRELASVFRRLWVQVALVFVGIVGMVAMLTLMSLASLWVLLGMVIIAGLILVSDAAMRACPACKRLLAGNSVAIKHTGSYTESVRLDSPSGGWADRTTHSYEETWQCVCCGHRWVTR